MAARAAYEASRKPAEASAQWDALPPVRRHAWTSAAIAVYAAGNEGGG